MFLIYNILTSKCYKNPPLQSHITYKTTQNKPNHLIHEPCYLHLSKSPQHYNILTFIPVTGHNSSLLQDPHCYGTLYTILYIVQVTHRTQKNKTNKKTLQLRTLLSSSIKMTPYNIIVFRYFT